MTTLGTEPAIHRIQQVLTRTVAPGRFATRRAVPAPASLLEVDGVGAIPLPLSARTAKQLCAVARPARYGLRDKTLLDPRVRDTWEIERRRVTLDARHGPRLLDHALPLIARDLGVPQGATLRAELHNLLVYGPGQFFAPHQDSEKADRMIGSLVVLLPSAAKGGALVIEHHHEQVSYRGAAKQLVLVAFYADCRHEVRPVTAGYRAALTFNLFLDADASVTVPSRLAAAPTPAHELTAAVRAYFTTPRPAWGPLRPATPPPERLVYLLDHEYTQHGLSWATLKNGDAVRAAVLREVAAHLDCEIVLALADVHETWSCEDDWAREAAYRRRRSWYARGTPEVEPAAIAGATDTGLPHDEHELIELCSSEVALRHWVGTTDRPVRPISSELLNDEICFTKPSVELMPFRSEHEGYTGNAGNTVERWYHRAAVLMWPRTRTFAIHAKASPAWGIREVAKLLARGKGDTARQRLDEQLPFWASVAPRESSPGFADVVLQVAAGVADPTLAATLVAPLQIEQTTPAHAPVWVALLSRYGLAWCAQVFERWSAREGRSWDPSHRLAWLVTLPALAAKLCPRDAAHGSALVSQIVGAQWTWLSRWLDRWCAPPLTSGSRRDLEAAGGPIIGLLAAAEHAGDHAVSATIVARLTSTRGYPLVGALAVLRAGAKAKAKGLNLGSLHRDWTAAVTRLRGTPPRAPGDWSIATRLACPCELCARLAQFLQASDQRQLEWRLAKDRRAHVHQVITGYELPLTHVTRRIGSPFTLVLTKTEALFAQDAAERDGWARALAWLQAHAATA